MHILICLSYLNQTLKFEELVNKPNCNFNTKISSFVEYYSALSVDPCTTSPSPSSSQSFDIDKKTILDLCAHIFLVKTPVSSMDMGDLNDMRQSDKMKEFENE